jgi:type II secretory pathway pseudopilin PulG
MISTRRILEICVFVVVAILAAMAFHAWLSSHDEQVRLQSTLATQKQQLDEATARERDRAGTLNQTLAEIEKLKREVQTPQEILRELPQYLKLPQPIVLDSEANADETSSSAGAKKNRKGTDLFANSRGANLAGGSASSSASASASASEQLASRGVARSTEKGDAVDTAPKARARSARTEAGPTNPAGVPNAASRGANTPSAAAGKSSSPVDAEIPTADLKPLYDYVQNCRECQAQLATATQNRTDDATKLQAMTLERDAAVTAAKGGTFWRRLRRNIAWFAVGAAAGAAAGTTATYASSHRR